MQRPNASVLASLLVGCLTASPAAATAIFTADTSISELNQSLISAESSGHFTVPNFGPAPGSHSGQAAANASSAGVRASSRATGNTPQGNLSRIEFAVSSQATMFFDDFLITGPATGLVFGSPNIELDGTRGVSVTPLGGLFDGRLTSFVGVSVNVEIRFNYFPDHQSFYGFGGSFSQSKTVECPRFFPFVGTGICMFGPELTSEGAQGTGILAGETLPLSPDIPEVMLPVGIPFSIAVRLETSAGLHAFIGTTGVPGPDFLIDSLSDFSHTLTFDPTEVFDLPEGFTLNSVQAGITNNELPTGSAPVPSTLMLVGALAIALAGLRARRSLVRH